MTTNTISPVATTIPSKPSALRCLRHYRRYIHHSYAVPIVGNAYSPSSHQDHRRGGSASRSQPPVARYFPNHRYDTRHIGTTFVHKSRLSCFGEIIPQHAWCSRGLFFACTITFAADSQSIYVPKTVSGNDQSAYWSYT